MIKKSQIALVKKDILGITSNKQMILALLIVPFVMVLFLPTIFIGITTLIPAGSNDIDELRHLLPINLQINEIRPAMIDVILNKMIPLFFLMIPIMAASVMAASSFIGEKEKRTLETLLYCPLSLRQIFYAKIYASFVLSMFVSLVSFVVMLIVVELELSILMGMLFIPDIEWLFILLLISPSLSFMAITIIVRSSAKAQTVEQAQQSSIFLILPIVILVVGQFMGILVLSVWLLLIFGVVLVVAARFLVQEASQEFTYEKLLK